MRVGILGVLWLAVLVSAWVQVSLVNWHRELVKNWQTQEKESVSLHQEYTQLLLERSTLTAHGRLDQQARQRLNMQDATDIRVMSL